MDTQSQKISLSLANSVDSFACPYCHSELSHLSLQGRDNHVDWCRIIVGVPDAPQKHGVTD